MGFEGGFGPLFVFWALRHYCVKRNYLPTPKIQLYESLESIHLSLLGSSGADMS